MNVLTAICCAKNLALSAVVSAILTITICHNTVASANYRNAVPVISVTNQNYNLLLPSLLQTWATGVSQGWANENDEYWANEVLLQTIKTIKNMAQLDEAQELFENQARLEEIHFNTLMSTLGQMIMTLRITYPAILQDKSTQQFLNWLKAPEEDGATDYYVTTYSRLYLNLQAEIDKSEQLKRKLNTLLGAVSEAKDNLSQETSFSEVTIK